MPEVDRRPHIVALLLSGAAGLSLLASSAALSIHVDGLERARAADQERAVVLGRLAHVEQAVASEITSALVELSALATWVGLHPDLSHHEFSLLSAAMRRRHAALRSTTWLPGDVIAYTYPPNRALTGLDVGHHESQGPAVAAMRMRDAPLLTGPIQLQQGGTGLILRAPVRRGVGNADGGRGEYLGHVSMVFDLARLRAVLTKLSRRYGLDLQLRDADAAGMTQGLSLSTTNARAFTGQLTLFMDIAQERFALAARPRAPAAPVRVPLAVLLGASALLSLGTALLVHSRLRLRAYNRELSRSRAAALRSAEAKAAFVATVSHELRTPMNGMLATAELLRDTPLQAAQRELVDVLVSSGRGLLALINEVLDFSKLEAGKMRLDPVPTSIHELIAEVAALVRGEVDRKGLVFETDVADDVPGRLVLDSVRVRQVLLNLVTNAIKFTEEGAVRVRARMEPGRRRLRLEVEDEGIGIEDTGMLFREFTQADASTTRRYGGTGLGLSICKRIADLMGGEIGADSVVGEGSLFWFELAVVAHVTPLPPRPSLDQDERRSEQPVPSGKALVVDDNPVNRLVARKVLERFGWRVDLAEDGEAGVQAALASDYDLIFMDCQMPSLDGFGATEALRARGCQVPIIAMTANSEAADRARCMSVGMSDHLSKPVQLESIVAIIHKWHGGRGLHGSPQ